MKNEDENRDHQKNGREDDDEQGGKYQVKRPFSCHKGILIHLY